LSPHGHAVVQRDALSGLTNRFELNTAVISRGRTGFGASIILGQQVRSNIKIQVESNPELRMQRVRRGQRTVILRLSVDEAVELSPQWQDFLSEHERRYGQEFAKLIEALRAQLK